MFGFFGQQYTIIWGSKNATPRIKGYVYISMGCTCITSYWFMMIRLSTVLSETQIVTYKLYNFDSC